ncbi:MAG: type II toxin-antitoxin system VapC family toxin [Acidobacteria bacterium]|nr:type II toxin-antitoxin system VapC family toxin [Acidobacteriota bacterium]
MSRYALDTSAYGAFRRQDPRVITLIDEASWIGMPSIVLGELFAGFANGTRTRQNQDLLQSFLAHPVVETLAVDESVASIYSELLTALRQQGTPIPTNDIWIAATAIRHAAPLVTSDQHFHRVIRLASIVLPPTP